MSGKGDKRRPTNEPLYRIEYERIFSKPIGDPKGTNDHGKTDEVQSRASKQS